MDSLSPVVLKILWSNGWRCSDRCGWGCSNFRSRFSGRVRSRSGFLGIGLGGRGFRFYLGLFFRFGCDHDGWLYVRPLPVFLYDVVVFLIEVLLKEKL